MKPISSGKDMNRIIILGKVWMDCTKNVILKAKMSINFLRTIRFMYSSVRNLISLRRQIKRGKTEERCTNQQEK